MNIIYLSAYLCKKYDIHKRIQWKPNNRSYINNYSQSIANHKLNAIIFVDFIPNDMFVSDYVKFLYTEINDYMHPHDARFVYFMKYILNSDNDTENDYYVLTDVTDVIVINPPEKIISMNKDILYVGTENGIIMKNEWFSVYLKYFDGIELINDYDKLFDNKIILNCGIIMAHRQILLKLLVRMVTLMIKLYHLKTPSAPLDMFVINYVIYKYYPDHLYTGNKLNTRFGHNEYDDNKCFKHK